MPTAEFMTLALTAALMSAGEAVLAMMAALLLSAAAIMIGVVIVVFILEHVTRRH